MSDKTELAVKGATGTLTVRTPLRSPSRPGRHIGEIRRRNELGMAGRGRLAWLPCPECGEPRWTSAKRPAARCQSCNGRRRARRVDLNAYPHTDDCACLRCRAVRGETTGSDNPSWVGGRVRQSNGYIQVLVEGRYVLEHRLIAERMLGRPLADDEEVHHINEVKHDNRPENLRVMKRSDHRRLHNLMRYGGGS